MKKIFSLALVVLMLGCSAQAFASTLSPVNFDGLYTVDSNSGPSSTTPNNPFDFNEVPWLYLNLPSSPSPSVASSAIQTAWFYGSELTPRLTVTRGTNSSTQETFWLGPLSATGTVFSTGSSWNDIVAAGDWHITADYQWLNNGGNVKGFGSESTKFSVNEAPTVTPEPISMALFGMGAGVLGLTRIRRKK